jgi:C4-type Zn-finger protein
MSAAASEKDLTVSIVDQAGRSIISRSLSHTETLQIDISQLSRGLYFCMIRDARTQWQVGSKVAVY